MRAPDSVWVQYGTDSGSIWVNAGPMRHQVGSILGRLRLDWGLANEICPPQELLPTVLKLTESIANNAPVAVRQAKQAIHKGLQMGLGDGLAFEIEAYNRTIPTQDRREGVLAFNEKRAPKFKGE